MLSAFKKQTVQASLLAIQWNSFADVFAHYQNELISTSLGIHSKIKVIAGGKHDNRFKNTREII